MAFSPGVFYKEVREELRKVSWPTREQTVATTVVVVILVVIITAYLGFADAIFSRLAQVVLG
jgi:preprotein translocase subunit SecE